MAPHPLPINPALPYQAQAGPSQQQWLQQPAYPYQQYPGAYQNYYAAPNQSYNPLAAPVINPSFGQNLFKPTATPEGYSYLAPPQYYGQNFYPAQPYQQDQSQAYPNKRTRIDNPAQSLTPNQAGPSGTSGGVKAWRNCSLAGCKFVGSGDDVEVHEMDRHLIYPPGYQVERSEEEERYAKRKGPAPTIEGTGITLQTDEDIAKWVAERKSKWPSSKRLAEKTEERQAAIARGEMPDRGRGRGRGRGGFSSRREDPAAQAEDWGREAPDPNASHPVRGRERGRGRGRGAARGGRHGAPPGGQDETPRDSGWARPAQTPSQAQEPGIQSPPEPKTDTSEALVGVDYDSGHTSDASSSSSSLSSSSESESDSDSDSASEADEPEVSSKAAGPAKPPVAEEEKGNSRGKAPCKYFARNGRCKFGRQCKFDHPVNQSEPTNSANTAIADGLQKKGPRQPHAPPKRQNPFERPSMLADLLAVPIQNTLSQLSQTIRFLVANNMLEGVELKPGDADEQEREANKIVVVGEQAGAEDTDPPALAPDQE